MNNPCRDQSDEYYAAMEELRKQQQSYTFFLNKRNNIETEVLYLRINKMWVRAITCNGLELYRYAPNTDWTDHTLGTIYLDDFTH